MYEFPSYVKGFLDWIDGHPRTGWYLWALMLGNYLLDLLQVLL